MKSDIHKAPVRCPGCGSETAATFKGEASGGYAVSLGTQTIPAPSYTVWQCNRCGLLYKVGTLTDSQLGDYYANIDFKIWGVGILFPTDRAVLKILRRLPRGAQVLDYGCSSGRLLKEVLGTLDCFGYEPNAAAASQASELGIRMVNDQHLNDGSLHFDAIVLMDVFEHFRYPTEQLARLFALLRPGGVMILATGNFDAPAFRRDPAEFWYFTNVEHLCVLGREYANYLCRSLPADITHWEEISHYDTAILSCFMQHLKTFAYYAYRQKTFISKFILPCIYGLRRARNWRMAPGLSCTQDHVVLALRKAPEGV